jgi:hypothetical protein
VSGVSEGDEGGVACRCAEGTSVRQAIAVEGFAHNRTPERWRADREAPCEGGGVLECCDAGNSVGDFLPPIIYQPLSRQDRARAKVKDQGYELR